jgi:hypothetical protein
VLVQERNLARVNFPRQCNDVVRDELVLVQEEKLAHFFLPPRWDDVVPDELVLLQEACASFPPL